MCYSKFDREFLCNLGGVEHNSFLAKIDPYPEEYEENEEPTIIIDHSSYYDIENLIAVMNKNKKQFSIFSTNIESINAKIDELKFFINMLYHENLEFSAICIQEAWQRKGSDFSRFEIEGYTLIPQGYSKLTSHKGGLLIYLNNKYNYTKKQTLDSFSNWEGQVIQVKKGNFLAKPVILGNIYRRPLETIKDYQEFIEQIKPVLKKIDSSNSDVAICGDFNVDLLEINSKSAVSDVFDMFTEYSLFPKITLPTRFSRKRGTLIDNVYCKITDNTLNTISGVTTKKLSDHQGYFTFINNSIIKDNNSKYITIDKQSDECIENFKLELQTSLNSVPLVSDLHTDPNINYNTLHNVIQDAKRKHMPTIKVKFNKYRHKKNKWITDEIITLIRERDNLYKTNKMTNPDSLEHSQQIDNLKSLNSKIKKSIRHAKKAYYDNIFNKLKSDIKGTWKQIKEILNKSKNKNTFPSFFRDENNKIITDKYEIANKFNIFFSSIGEKLAQNIQTHNNLNYRKYLTKSYTKCFKFQNITDEVTNKIIDSLAPKTSSGFDELSTKLIKKAKEVILTSITLLINQMINTGIFPDKLKIAKINPIYKKDDETLFTNYRPISLLPAISKIFEKVLFQQIYEYFQEKKLFYNSQYGFRTGHSPEFAAMELVDKIITYMDKNDTPIGIFIDLTKAFDTIDHSILLQKLRYYGFTELAVNLMQSYLTERTQYVQIDNTKSDFCSITTGIPQGSILGPLLFIIYMNDIAESSDLFDFVLFADDTSLTTTVKLIMKKNNVNLQTCINDELDKINVWLKLNKLSLNIKKTKYMIFHTINKRIPNFEIKIEGDIIERVSEFNFLGITLDDQLRWNKHIDKIANKISRNIGILNCLKHFIPISTKLTIYNSLVLSHINYGLLLWGYSCKRIETLQKKSVRTISLSKYNAHTEPILKHLKLLKVSDILTLQTLKFYYKYRHGQLPLYLLNLPFQYNYETHRHNTRRRNQIHRGTPAHAFAVKSLRHNLPLVVNSTIPEILDKINTHSLQGFSGYIKFQYISNYNDTCEIMNCYICNRI